MYPIYVRNGNVDEALRILKSQMDREGIMELYKAHEVYESPSEKRHKISAEWTRKKKYRKRMRDIR